MNSGVLTLTTFLCSSSSSVYDSKRLTNLHHRSYATLTVQCSNSNPDMPLITENFQNEGYMTGGAYDFQRATTSLTNQSLSSSKKVTLVRHGLSSWNEEGRVQGSSNLSVLTETGVKQAERCRKALAKIYFDQCFSSPISRAKSTAEVIWHGKKEPLVFLDSLKEAHLFYLEGMTNVDAKDRYPKEYTTWREDPSKFNVNGIYPVRKLWGTAREAWREILLSPGESFLIVTHKSILRALICTALGLPPERYIIGSIDAATQILINYKNMNNNVAGFLDNVINLLQRSFRAIDVNNGGISVFNFNKRGEAMLQSLNMTAHMYSDHFYLY